MGFFSWKTSDTNRSISNVYSSRGTFKVTMLMPNGDKFTEDSYEGYGTFGGIDFYDAVYELNKDNPKFADEMSAERERRSIGLTLAFNYEGVIFPRLVEDESLAWGDVGESPNCQSQGYFYGGVE